MRKNLLLLFVVSIVIFTGCKKDPLPSWNDKAESKSQIIKFVKQTTDSKSQSYVPASQRIAVFDLDGTLYSESYPTFFCFSLFIHRVLNDSSYTATPEDIEIAKTALTTGKTPALGDRDYVLSVFAGMTQEQFAEYVRKFVEEDQPGYSNLKRNAAFFKPMVELIRYLVKNDFTVYVVSGTDRTITRVLASLIDIPSYQVIGTDAVIAFSKQKDTPYMKYIFEAGNEVVLLGQRKDINLQMKKVESIVNEIGIKPIFTFGNAMTDASMLNYVIYDNKHLSKAFVILPDDNEREFGNPEEVEKLKEACKIYGWTPVSMKNDWLTIYGTDVKKK